MGLFELMQLKSFAEKISVSADPSAFIEVVEGLGIKGADRSLVESVAKAIKLTARDPNHSVGEWFRDGGLARLIAGRRPEDASVDDACLQCPHCDGLLLLTAP